MKQSYIIQEVRAIDSQRGGFTFYGTIQSAKTKAAQSQSRAGNILKICDASGKLICHKTDGKWVTV